MGSVLSVFSRATALDSARIGRENAGADLAGATAVSVTAAGGATAADGVSQTGAEGATQVAEQQTQPQQPQTQDDESWPPHQCGLENWGPDVTVRRWEGPQRIKETTLTADEQKRFRAILDQCFHPDTIMGVKVQFQPDDVMDVVDKVIPYFESEPMLIEDVPFGVTIVGDIHGQLYDLFRVFKGDSKDDKPGWECTRYVFMGDYVDRGRQSLEVVMALFCLKMLYPDRIFMLRGNHEFIGINETYGFFVEMMERYDTEIGEMLYFTINEAFLWISVAAIVGNIYFCSHGGVTSGGYTRRDLRATYKPFFYSMDDLALHDITWSDPAQGLRGSAFNKDRGSSHYFGFDSLCHTMAAMEVVAIFRGHSRMQEGYENSWNVCFTIFTATNYGNTGNIGAVAVVALDGKVGFRLMIPDKERSSWEKDLKQLEYEVKKKPDAKPEPDEIGDRGIGHVTRMGGK